MTTDEQIDEWVKGNPIHNTTRDECCPDFSCCDRKSMAPLHVRQRFAQAHREGDENTIFEMLNMFLSAGVQSWDSDVYIAGINTGPES